LAAGRQEKEPDRPAAAIASDRGLAESPATDSRDPRVAIPLVAAPEPTALQRRQLTLPTAYTLPFAHRLERAIPHARPRRLRPGSGRAGPADRRIC